MSDWYYAVDNEQKGPINESELKAHLATNTVPPDVLVWKDGMDNWTPANQVPAFSFRPPPAPAKIQPGAATSAGTTAASPTVSNPESTQPVDIASLMGTPEALEVTVEDVEKNKVMGILAYVPIPIPLFWLIPLFAAKDSPFAKYHANQGLILFVLWLVVMIVVMIFDGVFGMVGLYSLDWIFGLLYLCPIGLAIFGIINAAAGKCVPLPVIGGLKLLK